MIEFIVTIGGQQYPLKATDRKLFSLLASFDDRVRQLICAPPDPATIEAQFREILTIGALLDDSRLAAIDRWLEQQNAPSLSCNASIQEIVQFFATLINAAANGVARDA